MTEKQLKWQKRSRILWRLKGVESSIELGFNAKRRCTFGVCRKPAIEGSEYCREHKEYMEERQCQR